MHPRWLGYPPGRKDASGCVFRGDIDVTVRRLVKYLSPGKGRGGTMGSNQWANNGGEEKNGDGSKVTRRSVRIRISRGGEKKKEEEGTGISSGNGSWELVWPWSILLIDSCRSSRGIFSRKFEETDCAHPPLSGRFLFARQLTWMLISRCGWSREWDRFFIFSSWIDSYRSLEVFDNWYPCEEERYEERGVCWKKEKID